MNTQRLFRPSVRRDDSSIFSDSQAACIAATVVRPLPGEHPAVALLAALGITLTEVEREAPEPADEERLASLIGQLTITPYGTQAYASLVSEALALKSKIKAETGLSR